MKKTTLTPAGRAVLQQLADHPLGRQADYVVDGRALCRLEEQGFITAEGEVIPRPGFRPRRKTYIVITDAGRAALGAP